MQFPKRLIEVDLPIKRISAHARREKSIRHGHISTLHIWWARRPLASCRAVICASLWPDPADPDCPPAFRTAAADLVSDFARRVTGNVRLSESTSKESMDRWMTIKRVAPGAGISAFDVAKFTDLVDLRAALFDFIADFANWDNSTVSEYLETARALTQVAHEALGGIPATRPMVVDPFAGGGSIPLEALRAGADVFASDLNPVAVLLNKVVLEYIPAYGSSDLRMKGAEGNVIVFRGLAEAVRYWGRWVKKEAEQELSGLYPKSADGATPIAYLWARTIKCEGPGCGVEVPLLRSAWLAKRTSGSVALQILPSSDGKRVDLDIIISRISGWVKQSEPKSPVLNPSFDGTIKRGAVTCPCCGYTTPVESVRSQLKMRHGGTGDARLICVVTTNPGEQGRRYQTADSETLKAARQSAEVLERRKESHSGDLPLVPNESISLNELRRISLPLYGMNTWGEMFTPRQLLALTTVSRLVTEVGGKASSVRDARHAVVVASLLALAVDRLADSLSSSVTWTPGGEFQGHTFARQALAFVSDFAEINPWCDSSGNWTGAVEWVSKVCETGAVIAHMGQSQSASATRQPLPDDSADSVITDPPYYDAVPYAHLSDFFYVWLRRSVGKLHSELFEGSQVIKNEEIVVDRPHRLSTSTHDIDYYERELTKAFIESRRILRPRGICVIVFASKTTASWEAILKAVVDAGWTITGSWPIDTEREARISAQGQSRLASSVHLVCRPRERGDGSLATDLVGDWRQVLSELPKRIHDWMPRLAHEGVVGADAIFACLGPALEIYSRYSRVEKASGEMVLLREYLEHVWAAVSREALQMIFAGADASGFEEDARLTAMWLWTLQTEDAAGDATSEIDENGTDDDESSPTTPRPAKGFGLEYDAARKIAQGLGAHLERLTTLIEVRGDKARLLPVSERAKYLIGGRKAEPAKTQGRRGKVAQGKLFEIAATAEETETAEAQWGEIGLPQPGNTVLDRVHQSMLLFVAGRGDALKRFLVTDGAGADARFWTLAQALSALYPSGCEEKRWVDGVLARKKGLGF